MFLRNRFLRLDISNLNFPSSVVDGRNYIQSRLFHLSSKNLSSLTIKITKKDNVKSKEYGIIGNCCNFIFVVVEFNL